MAGKEIEKMKKEVTRNLTMIEGASEELKKVLGMLTQYEEFLAQVDEISGAKEKAEAARDAALRKVHDVEIENRRLTQELSALKEELSKAREDVKFYQQIAEEAEADSKKAFNKGREQGIVDARAQLANLLSPRKTVQDLQSEFDTDTFDGPDLENESKLKKELAPVDFGLPFGISEGAFPAKEIVYADGFLVILKKLSAQEQKKIVRGINNLLNIGPSSVKARKLQKETSRTPAGAMIATVGQPWFTYRVNHSITFFDAGMHQ